MVALRKPTPEPRKLVEAPTILRREPCEDQDGTAYTVLVWRVYPGLPITRYTLMDRTPVDIVSDREFLLPSGLSIFRC